MSLTTYLTGIADALREKKGASDTIPAQDFADEIRSISEVGTMEFKDNSGKAYDVLSIANLDVSEEPSYELVREEQRSRMIQGLIVSKDGNIIYIDGYLLNDYYYIRKTTPDFSTEISSLAVYADSLSTTSFSHNTIIELDNDDLITTDRKGINYITGSDFKAKWTKNITNESGDYYNIQKDGNNVWVFDPSTSFIEKLNGSGDTVSTLRNTESRGYQCFYVDEDENYYLGNKRYIYKYTKTGTSIKSYYTGSTNYAYIDMLDIILTESGDIVVRRGGWSDSEKMLIVVFAQDGTTKLSQRSKDQYGAVAVQGNIVFIGDGNGRVFKQKITNTGYETVWTCTLSGTSWVDTIAPTTSYIYAGAYDEIYKLSQDKKLKTYTATLQEVR